MGLNVWLNLRNFRVVSCCRKFVCGIVGGGEWYISASFLGLVEYVVSLLCTNSAG